MTFARPGSALPEQAAPESAQTPGEAPQVYREALDRAMRMLALREHSASELLRKLATKGVAADLAAQVVSELREQNLQSDERFAEAFVRSGVGRGYGPIWIRQSLRQRGIGDDLAEIFLTEPGAYWTAQALRARNKRFGEAPPANRAEWGRQARFLAQRGFPADLIYRALGRHD